VNRLDEIEARLNAVTNQELPWPDAIELQTYALDDEADAALIAAAPDDLAWLISEVKRLERLAFIDDAAYCVGCERVFEFEEMAATRHGIFTDYTCADCLARQAKPERSDAPQSPESTT
jgi:hypothetical protein